MSQVIGIDLGGTAIKLGRFNHAGDCLQSFTIVTPQPAYPDPVIAAIVAALPQLDPERQASAIGIGTPGPADINARIARNAINLPGWQNVPLADQLEAQSRYPVVVANDANCAALGEAWLGAGRRFQNLILLTLGTGVGGGVILNGELFVGPGGSAGELGLVTVDLHGPACNSGNRGSLEQHVSAQAIRRRTGLEPEALARQALAGDPQSLAFWQTYGQELAAGLASLIYVLTPEAIILGGGICAGASLFFPSLEAELGRRVVGYCRDTLEVLVAELGNRAGMVGAARLAIKAKGEPINGPG
jgi:glucokinase